MSSRGGGLWDSPSLEASLRQERHGHARAYGIAPGAKLHFAKSGIGMRAAYGSASRSVNDLRAGKAKELRYMEEERKAQEEARKKKGE